MVDYVHHTPGRLRIRTNALKRNTAYAVNTRETLKAVPGIVDCEVNVLTGSVTIRYDHVTVTKEEIHIHLSRCGKPFSEIVLHTPSASRSWTSSKLLYSASATVGKAVTGMVIEKVIERSALALVGAML